MFEYLLLSRLSRELLSGALSHDLLLGQYYVRESSQEFKSSQVRSTFYSKPKTFNVCNLSSLKRLIKQLLPDRSGDICLEVTKSKSSCQWCTLAFGAVTNDCHITRENKLMKFTQTRE